MARAPSVTARAPSVAGAQRGQRSPRASAPLVHGFWKLATVDQEPYPKEFHVRTVQSTQPEAGTMLEGTLQVPVPSGQPAWATAYHLSAVAPKLSTIRTMNCVASGTADHLSVMGPVTVTPPRSVSSPEESTPPV
jgi:hypothetical protein